MCRVQFHLVPMCVLAILVTVTVSRAAESKVTHSKVLAREMLVVTYEAMRAQKPNADTKALKQEVKTMVAAEIKKARKVDPGFLMVSPDTAKCLASKKPVPGAAKRIAAAEKTLNGQVPIIAKVLLEKHKSGKLSARRTELLAHVMELARKTYLGALTK